MEGPQSINIYNYTFINHLEIIDNPRPANSPDLAGRLAIFDTWSFSHIFWAHFCSFKLLLNQFRLLLSQFVLNSRFLDNSPASFASFYRTSHFCNAQGLPVCNSYDNWEISWGLSRFAIIFILIVWGITSPLPHINII